MGVRDAATNVIEEEQYGHMSRRECTLSTHVSWIPRPGLKIVLPNCVREGEIEILLLPVRQTAVCLAKINHHCIVLPV